MKWYGKLIGAVIGWMLLRHPAGALLGAVIGHAFDAGWFALARKAPPAPRSGPQPQDDYRILGVAEACSDEELDRAYRRLMSQYHPDRVAGAADEFRELAEQRSRSINAAYDRVRTRRRHASTDRP